MLFLTEPQIRHMRVYRLELGGRDLVATPVEAHTERSSTILVDQCGFHLADSLLDVLGKSGSPPTEAQVHDTGIRDRAMFRDPLLPHEIFHYVTQCRRRHTQRCCGVRHVGFGMTAQKQKDSSLEWRHMDRLQTSSEPTVQLQHDF